MKLIRLNQFKVWLCSIVILMQVIACEDDRVTYDDNPLNLTKQLAQDESFANLVNSSQKMFQNQMAVLGNLNESERVQYLNELQVMASGEKTSSNYAAVVEKMGFDNISAFEKAATEIEENKGILYEKYPDIAQMNEIEMEALFIDATREEYFDQNITVDMTNNNKMLPCSRCDTNFNICAAGVGAGAFVIGSTCTAITGGFGFALCVAGMTGGYYTAIWYCDTTWHECLETCN